MFGNYPLLKINDNTNFWLKAYTVVWYNKAFRETFHFEELGYGKRYPLMPQILNPRSVIALMFFQVVYSFLGNILSAYSTLRIFSDISPQL